MHNSIAPKRHEQPNVLLLTVDALRADRLSVYGYERPTTPVLEQLAHDAIVCENAFTLGPFTQIACIQLFTSSRPFDYGGYDEGAVGRPETLFQRFRRAGYDTWGLSTIHWVSPYYGYTDGLDTELSVFHLNTLAGMAVVNMRDTLRTYHEGNITADAMLARATPVIRRMFDNIDDYCDKLKERMPSYVADFPGSKVANDGYDFDKIKKIVEVHRRDFQIDPLSYIHQNLHTKPASHEWLARDWHYTRTFEKLVRHATFALSNRLLRLVSPKTVNERVSQVRMAVDAHAIADKVIGQLRSRETDKPFFIWAHFKDTHHPFVSGPGREWYRHTPDYLEAVGYDRNIDPTLSFRVQAARNEQDRAGISALYDAAVRSTDEAVGKILKELDLQGLTEDTVVGFCGDHGEEIGEHNDYGHECMVYEHNARIPMLLKPAGGGGQRIQPLICSLDLAPSICDLAEIDPVPDWAGISVDSDEASQREHIIFENFCRGDCLFEHRPVYMGVRSKTHKYLWKEYLDPNHKAGSPEPELYDLRTDPEEHRDIFRSDHPLVPQFNALIADRLAEVPEVSSERIVDAFGAVGAEAVDRVRAKGLNAAD